MILILATVFFAFVYAVKGASVPYVVKLLEKAKSKNPVYDKLLSADAVASCAVLIFILVFTTDMKLALLSAAAFWLACAPSMGEEHGAVGRIGHSWGEYIDKGFGRSYGVKKALQRGVWMGALMALSTGYLPFICFSLLFVPSVFLGQELNYRVFKKDGWALAEPIIGAVVFGLPFGLFIQGI